MPKSYVDGVPQRGASEEEGSVRFDISPYILALITLVFITKNASATFRLKSRAYEFLQRVDGRMYDDNATLAWWIALAKNVGESVVKKGARDYPAIRYRALEDADWEEYHQTFFDNYEANAGIAVEGELLDPELSDELVRFADEYVSTRLRYNYIWAAKPVLREIVSRIDANDVGQVSEFGDHVLEALEALCHRGRQAKSVGGVGAVDFRTGDTTFPAAIRAAHQAANRPQALVRTGCRLLNDMLNGGYQGGRVYVHFGRSGDWKSGILCSAAFWATDPRFNPSFTTKDPTRKPIVLFITQENDVNETIERMISFALGSQVDLRGSSEEEMVRMLCEAYSSETCDFSFKYRQNRSISTADIDQMIQEEYLDGFEVVAVIHDYIKRIKSVETFKDARHLELGAVVDEESSLAKKYGIPFITGMQLNREAYAKIEAAAKTGRTDAVKELGAAQVGESLNVYENADVVIMQSRYFSESTRRAWLTVRRAKFRGKKRGGTDYFAQPFALEEDGETNEMLLEQDAHLDERQCAGRKDLGEAMVSEYDPNAGPGGRSSEERRAERTGQSLANPPPQSGPRRRPAAGGPSRRATAAGPPGGTIGATMEEMDMPAATTLEGL